MSFNLLLFSQLHTRCGVVTGVPMEFQFGTNWSQFARATGGVIGQPLAMEGVFSFFLESTFLGLFLFGEKRLSPLAHWASAFLVFVGSWISGFFIIVTNAWMQHPVAYRILPNGLYDVTSFWGLLTNPWALIEYAHTMSGAVITGAFVMCAVGAFYVLEDRFSDYGKVFLRVGVIAGLLSCCAQIFPTGDLQGKYTARHQPAALAAMEGLFNTQRGAAIVLLGQPNQEQRTIDNPLAVAAPACAGSLKEFLERKAGRTEPGGLASVEGTSFQKASRSGPAGLHAGGRHLHSWQNTPWPMVTSNSAHCGSSY